MKRKSLHMETTSISVIKTCLEIEEVLIKHSVTAIMKTIDNGAVSGIQFVYNDNGQSVPIKIPFRWQAIQKLAHNGNTGYNKTGDEEQARKVAARIELRWIQSMLAKVEVGMAEMVEIFMPYIMVNDGQSFYEKLSSENFKGLLTSG